MQFKSFLHLDKMKSKLLLNFIGLCLIITSCSVLHRQINNSDTSNEIQIDKTEMGNAMKLTGQSDDEFEYYACGRSSGHISGWSTYKKLGLALYSVSYTPDRQDGYKNGIVRDIGIFDTTNLTVRKSQQQRVYYGQGYYPISKPNLELVFGKPDKIKSVDTIQYISYSQKHLTFAFNKESNKFIRLYITNKK